MVYLSERIEALKQRIKEESARLYPEGYEDPVPALVEELRNLCPHIEKNIDGDQAICTVCNKIFAYRRS